MIDRDNAILTLTTLIDSNVLNDDICFELSEIRTCIRGEKQGYFLWGAANDYQDLYNIRKGDIEWQDYYEALFNKYKIK